MRLLMGIMAVAALFAVGGTAGNAAPSLEHSCIAVGGSYQHVAAVVAQPEDCCKGRLQCSQYLSTTTVVRPAHDQRT